MGRINRNNTSACLRYGFLKGLLIQDGLILYVQGQMPRYQAFNFPDIVFFLGIKDKQLQYINSYPRTKEFFQHNITP